MLELHSSESCESQILQRIPYAYALFEFVASIPAVLGCEAGTLAVSDRASCQLALVGRISCFFALCTGIACSNTFSARVSTFIAIRSREASFFAVLDRVVGESKF